MIRADIRDPGTGEVIGTCVGADSSGHCPLPPVDGRIPCAGYLLDAQAPEVHWGLTIPVPSHAYKCPLRGFSRS